MGKGDIRTRKGKTSAGSYGNKRPHSEAATPAKQPAAKPAAAVKKAPAKKATAKKA